MPHLRLDLIRSRPAVAQPALVLEPQREAAEDAELLGAGPAAGDLFG